MAPGASAGDLLYVSDLRYVLVYSYPQGKLVGILRHFYLAEGECVDAKGDVYIVDGGFFKIFEYAHGGTKRIATLSAPPGTPPSGCAIDPTTGDLAVTTLKFTRQAVIGVYKMARGKPATYADPALLQYYDCGYDDHGNLFASAENESAAFGFAELPKGAKKLETITLNQHIGFPDGVQWDGKHLAVGDGDAPVIYQFDIHGRVGTKVGTTRLGGHPYDVGFFIAGSTLIVPSTKDGSHRSYVAYYDYPAGGKPTKKITRRVVAAQGTALSKPSP